MLYNQKVVKFLVSNNIFCLTTAKIVNNVISFLSCIIIDEKENDKNYVKTTEDFYWKAKNLFYYTRLSLVQALKISKYIAMLCVEKVFRKDHVIINSMEKFHEKYNKVIVFKW